MDVTRKSKLCLMQMESLDEHIAELARAGFPRFMGAGYATPKNASANRTAVHREIVELRQQLLALDKAIEDEKEVLDD